MSALAWLLTGATLESSRDVSIGDGVRQEFVNSQWVEVGRIENQDQPDPHPWLRAVQREGLELVIIGSTLEAVHVCNEAFHAGFKPVLIIMEDQVTDPNVDKLLERLSPCCWSRYPFRTGPVLISSKSEACMVRLDDDGSPVDTYVRTNIAGMSSNAEAWQFFKGPVLVVDPIDSVADAEDDAAYNSAESSCGSPTGGFKRGALEKRIEQESWKRRATTPSEAGSQKGDDKVPMLPSSEGDLPRTPTKKEASPAKGQDSASIREDQDDDGPVSREGTKGLFTAGGSTASERELRNARKLFLKTVHEQRATIVKPSYWHERYDPECFGLQLATYRKLLSNSLYSAGLLACFTLEGLARIKHTDWFGPVRAISSAVLFFPIWLAVATACSGTLGYMTRSRPNRMNIRVTLLTTLVHCGLLLARIEKYHLSFLAAWATSAAVLFVLVVMMGTLWERMAIPWVNLKWCILATVVPLTSLAAVVCIVMLFLWLCTVNDALAVLLFQPLFFIPELILVRIMASAYQALVWQSRVESGPNTVLGDQKVSLSCVTMIILGALETGKFTAIFVGSIRSNGSNYIFLAQLALLLGVLQNVLHRSLWAHCFLGRLFPSLLSWLCPDSMSAFCQDCKFVLWWTPILFVPGVVCGRGLIGQNWNIPPLETPDSSVWCWNQTTALLFGLFVVIKLCEDSFVKYLRIKNPAPVWATFGGTMQSRLDGGPTCDPCHLCHFLSHVCALDMTKKGLADRAQLSHAVARKTAAVTVSNAASDTDCVARILAGPNFKHTREIRHYQMLVVTSAQWAIFYTAITLCIGLGNFHTRCPPIDVEDAASVLRRLVLITTDAATECDS